MTAILLLLLLLFLLPPTAAAQHEERPWEQWLDELATDNGEDDGDETALWEDAYERLCELESQPLDLNRATREDLEQLPFLTSQQVEDICHYLYRYGPMRSLQELQMVASLDYRRRRLLSCFVYLGETEPQRPTLRQQLTGGRHELTAYAKVPLYRRKGDNNGYAGYPPKHWLRYQYAYGGWLKFGLLGAQDGGEPFFARPNRLGYDYYSFYLQIGRRGRLEQLTLGRYRVSAGMGLVVSGDFTLGKTLALATMGRNSNTTVRPHASRSAANYLQGAAATVRIAGGLTLTAFASYRYLDATLNTNGTAATLLSSGYHRTRKEIEKKDNTTRTDGGTHLAYRRGGFFAGATAVYSRLSRPLSPDTKARYRRYYPTGSTFLNTSIDYGYTAHRIAMRGETAVSRSGAIATLNTASVQLSSQLSLTAIHRFYSYRYTSLLANSFSDGGKVQNESGLYIGADWRPSQHLQLQAYTDFAYHPWARYQADASSQATDHLAAATWTPDDRWTFSARYRLHRQQKDDAGKHGLIWKSEHRLRLGTAYDCGRWNAGLQGHATLADYKERDWGWLLMARGGYRLQQLTVGAAVNYFPTTDYASRIYVYEQGLPYTLSFPSFYGHGIHYMLTARATLPHRLTLTARATLTNYFDRATIGSSYQQIDGSSMTDIELQARWRF